ncbi:hypothetical protein JOQ06_016753, partial [Pogonophryne albipinna]
TILDHLCPAGREPIVDTDTYSAEWSPFKELVHANYSNNSFQEDHGYTTCWLPT